jgi:UDP-N-acetylmuramate-alanine ligase
MESYRRIFSDALELLPQDGRLVVNADDSECLELARKAKVPFVSVGFNRASGKRLTGYRQNAAGCAFAFDGIPFQLAIWGKMNALNAALAAQAAALQGIGLPESTAALASFPGVSGRQELLASVQKCVVYSDEAYHPAALAPLLDGLKRRHPRRRLVLVLCLVNTGGKSGMAQRELPEILAKAEVVLLFPGYDPKPPPGGPFDHKLLARQLRSRGVQAATATTLPEMEKHVRQHVRNGDIVLIGLSPGPNVAALRLVEAVRGAVQRQRK